jgi:hypothetical protein
MALVELEIVPSIANVLEALKHPNVVTRTALLSGIQEWTAARPLNPWPTDLLRLSGEALLRGQLSFTVDDNSANAIQLRRGTLEEDHEQALRYLADLENNFIDPFRKNREALRRQLRKDRRRRAWPDLDLFLDFHTRDIDVIEYLLRRLWESVGLPHVAVPVDRILQSEVWRLALDGIGAAMYARAVAVEQQAIPQGMLTFFS